MSLQKLFMIRCQRCRWAETNTGVKTDLTHLTEVKNNCSNCGQARKFRCPKCGGMAKMTRLRGSAPPPEAPDATGII